MKICYSYSYLTTYRSTALIGLFVEFIKQKEEHDGMHANPPNESFRIITVNEKQLEGMNHNSDKLNLKKNAKE